MGRKFTVGILILAFLAGGAWYWYTHLRGPNWNVIVVTLGSTRADHVGCYGSPDAKTPALDELAQRGVLFER
ncbi:MAG: sulfatase-like hydrolase/transferase, partial [Planctomycetaceae bacterium]|nr:sulfatase-like hydrolase/transferase [Planctomycetaceae bacterium]